MFKKIVLISAILVFAFGVLMTSVYQTSAQTLTPDLSPNSLEFEVGEDEVEATETTKESVQYDLAYPGILPGHLLYPLKMIRDRVWLFLTTDSLKKAELLLKLADKRIWAAQMLVDQDKMELGVSTVTKAEKYLERVVDQEEIAREAGKDTAALLERLSLAALKHEEVVLLIKEQVPDSAQPVIESALEITHRVGERVAELLKE